MPENRPLFAPNANPYELVGIIDKVLKVYQSKEEAGPIVGIIAAESCRSAESLRLLYAEFKLFLSAGLPQRSVPTKSIHHGIDERFREPTPVGLIIQTPPAIGD